MTQNTCGVLSNARKFASKLHKMKFLNLSKGLQCTPAIAHETFVFSGGEPHLKITDRVVGEAVGVTVQARTAADFILLLMAIDALHHLGAASVEVFIPYFPAARQDRRMVGGEPLSVKVYAQMLNTAQVRRVFTFDAHSEVAPALLDRCTNISNHDFIRSVISAIPSNNLALVAPDAGSAKKMHHLAAALGWKNVVQCDKTRDVTTGQLSNPNVFTNDLRGMDCLIVDDICDGGGTFIQLAEALKNKNAGRIYLAVSHGIFSKGTDVLAPHFERIFTTNSFYNGGATPLIDMVPLSFPG